MPLGQIQRIPASFAGLTGSSVDAGACSLALSRLPGLSIFVDPDFSTSAYPPAEERVANAAPIVLDAAQGQVVTTSGPTANRRMLAYSGYTRGKQYLRAPSPADMTMVAVLYPYAATLQGAYEAGILQAQDTAGSTTRWVRLYGTTPTIEIRCYAPDGSSVAYNKQIGSNTALVDHRLSVLAAVFSTSRQVMELYIDDMTVPLVTGAMPPAAYVTADGTLEVGGYQGAYCGWKGLIGRTAAAGADLGSTANRPLLINAAAALKSYYTLGGGT